MIQKNLHIIFLTIVIGVDKKHSVYFSRSQTQFENGVDVWIKLIFNWVWKSSCSERRYKARWALKARDLWTLLPHSLPPWEAQLPQISQIFCSFLLFRLKKKRLCFKFRSVGLLALKVKRLLDTLEKWWCDALSSHIHGRFHYIFNYWNQSWMWEDGTSRYYAPKISNNYSYKIHKVLRLKLLNCILESSQWIFS